VIILLGKSSSSRPSNSGDTTFIAAECQITGAVIIKGNARVDGKIDGTINVSGDLTVGPGAILKANLEAKTITIAGEVHGDIKATDTLELSQSARLYGDIYSKQLKIEQGALFVGGSKSIDDPAAAVSRPALEKPDHSMGREKLSDKK